MNKFLFITGYARSGKDTLAEFLKTDVSVLSKYSVHHLSLAGPIWEMAKEYGWDGESKDLSSRRLAITIGETLGLELSNYTREDYAGNIIEAIKDDLLLEKKLVPDKHYWCYKLVEKIRAIPKNDNLIIISDVRKIKEYEFFKFYMNYDIMVARVVNDRIPKIQTRTETELDSIPFDYIVDNNGSLEDYYSEIKASLLYEDLIN